MTDLDALFEAFPQSTMLDRPRVITLRSTDDHNRPNFIADEGFLEAFYRGDFIYCLRNSIQYTRATRYSVGDVQSCLPPTKVVRCVESEPRVDVLLEGPDFLLAVAVRESSIFVDVGTMTTALGAELLAKLRTGLEIRIPTKEYVPFDIWSVDGFPSTRRFDDVTWTSVEDNYPASTRSSLASLMTMPRESVVQHGKIIIFHGPPGTGKTWAIRSLLTAWKTWSDPAIVIDPEVMLNSPEYFLKLLSNIRDNNVRVIVIEDADQIAEKNGTRGADLSRLLNMTDGLVGAGNDVIVLLSTNAAPSKLDAALLRPGRCKAVIGFEHFSATEASKRIGNSVSTPHTLAEIFEAKGAVKRVSNETTAATGQYL